MDFWAKMLLSSFLLLIMLMAISYQSVNKTPRMIVNTLMVIASFCSFICALFFIWHLKF